MELFSLASPFSALLPITHTYQGVLESVEDVQLNIFLKYFFFNLFPHFSLIFKSGLKHNTPILNNNSRGTACTNAERTYFKAPHSILCNLHPHLQSQEFKELFNKRITFFLLGNDRCLRLFGVGHNFTWWEIDLCNFGHSQFLSLTPKRKEKPTLTLNQCKIEQINKTLNSNSCKQLLTFTTNSHLYVNVVLIRVHKRQFNGK